MRPIDNDKLLPMLQERIESAKMVRDAADTADEWQLWDIVMKERKWAYDKVQNMPVIKLSELMGALKEALNGAED